MSDNISRRDEKSRLQRKYPVMCGLALTRKPETQIRLQTRNNRYGDRGFLYTF